MLTTAGIIQVKDTRYPLQSNGLHPMTGLNALSHVKICKIQKSTQKRPSRTFLEASTPSYNPKLVLLITRTMNYLRMLRHSLGMPVTQAISKKGV